MKNDEIVSYLERMEDRIMDYKLNINLFKDYCVFLQTLYKENYEIDYLKYAYLLNDANVIKPESQKDYLMYQYFKANILALIHKLEKNKSK